MTDTEKEAAGTNVNCLAGIRCPACQSEGPFHILASVLVEVTDEGTEDCGGDYEWNDEAFCNCPACGKDGTLKDFRIEETRRDWKLAGLDQYPAGIGRAAEIIMNGEYRINTLYGRKSLDGLAELIEREMLQGKDEKALVCALEKISNAARLALVTVPAGHADTLQSIIAITKNALSSKAD